MADISELISQLQSDNWCERRDAAKALGSVEKQHRKEAVRALKARLEVDEDDDVIKAIVEALAQMEALDDNVFEVLKDRISDSRPGVRQVVIRGLTKFQLWYRSGIVGRVIEHTLHQRWWRLPADFRRHFGPPWFWGELWHHHCPECYELIHLLERRGGRRQEAEWLIATMGRWWGSPRWHFARHDFEALIALRVEQNVTYEEQNVLRFRYLYAFATDRQGRPISKSAHQLQLERCDIRGDCQGIPLGGKRK